MTLPPNSISLVIPGLLGPQAQYKLLEPQERPVLKNLTTLLSRATRSEHSNDDWLGTVFDLLLPDSNLNQIPFAAISAGYDQLAYQDSYCLRIDPVYLRIDMDSAIMLASDELQLTEEEAIELADSINQHLKEDGIQIHTVHPHRWYMLFDSPPDINTTPLHQVMRKDVHEFLPQGDNHHYWHSLLNELQMLLHTHPVNQQREQRGLAPVNSVWFWGEGELPEKSQMNWNEIYTDEPLMEILADFCEIPCYDLNQYPSNGNKGNALIVMTGLEDSEHNQDIFAWIKALHGLDSSLFKSIREAFKIKRLQQFSLYPCNHEKFQLSMYQSRKWWKFNKPLAYFINA